MIGHAQNALKFTSYVKIEPFTNVGYMIPGSRNLTILLSWWGIHMVRNEVM
jgi:hypothetical protein